MGEALGMLTFQDLVEDEHLEIRNKGPEGGGNPVHRKCKCPEEEEQEEEAASPPQMPERQERRKWRIRHWPWQDQRHG